MSLVIETRLLNMLLLHNETCGISGSDLKKITEENGKMLKQRKNEYPGGSSKTRTAAPLPSPSSR